MSIPRNYEEVRWKIMAIQYAKDNPTSRTKEIALRCKKEVREFYKKVCAPKTERIVIDNGMDGYTVLVKLPETTDNLTYDQVCQYFDDWFSIPIPNSLYDCTGRPFTASFAPVKRQGHWFVYHNISFDV